MTRFLFTASAAVVVLSAAVATDGGPADASSFVQLTDCGEAVFPSLDASAQHVAFTGVCDPVGQNPDGGAEVFLLDVRSGRIAQLTSSPAGTYSAGPRLSASGRRVVFGSNADLVPGENADGSAETFIMNIDGTGLVQLTHTAADPPNGLPATFAPAIDHPGREVFFTSTLDLVPGGNADSNMEIFMFDVDSGAII